MPPDLTAVLGVLAAGYPPAASADDLDGPHGKAFRLWQRLGFIRRQPEPNPRPCCPRCREGVPRALGGRWYCERCFGAVDPRQLLAWPFDVEALLRWLSNGWSLQGDCRKVDESLWQLGSFSEGGLPTECFFCRGRIPSERGTERLLAFRRALLLRPLPQAPAVAGFSGPCVSLLEVLRVDGNSLTVGELGAVLHAQGAVGFDEATGALWLGERLLGEVAVGSKEHALLAGLWLSRDQYVSYRDLKRFVLRQTGSTDSTEEATFCQRLKSRIKKAIPDIDRLVTTTNKADGYRLRAAEML